ncbi:hypothetical protein PIB30_024268 [Stylosanthes scabra]|uniref:Ubiquitin-like protease family profile domain-containing protein n=1 Tax=Stylosanthes scabra TaxID=79078 RepID=A0ABU6VBX7_9FABA|nr:hypothetical protein [Stylosanthes scabra]
MRTLGLMEGDLPIRPIGRVWLRGLHAKHLYLGISGVYGDTRDISIHGLAPFYQILFISLFDHNSLTLTIATPVFLTTKIVPCVNSLGRRPESCTRLNLGFPTPPETQDQPPTTLDEEFPLTARTMAVIYNMDEHVNGPAPTVATPQPTQAIEDDFDERVATWATVPKGGNDYEPVFRLRGPKFLEAIRYQFKSMAPKSYIDIGIVGLMCHVLNREEGDRYEKLVYCLPPEILQRMFFTHDHNWMDKKKRRPYEISSLTNHKEYLDYIDREKLVSHRFSNILNQLLKWAGASSILKKGSWSLPTRYINVPQQPNDCDCAVFPMLDEFRKKLVTKIIMSKENSMRQDVITAAQTMRVTRPSAALRSPFIPFPTPDFPIK